MIGVLFFSANAHTDERVMQQKRPSAAMQSESRTVIDESGRTVRLPAIVQRVVTLAPNLAEIVYALGAQDKLVAVSNYTDYPAAAKSKPSIGMPVNPSLEAIVAAKPDVVLATAVNTWETVGSLERLGIPVYTTDPHDVSDMLRSVTDIGSVIGASDEATALVEKLRGRLDSLRAKLRNAPAVPVLFVVWEHPLQSVGMHTFIADALRYAGAESVIHTKQDWPLVSMEELVKLNPEHIIYADNPMGAGFGADSAKLADVSAAVAAHLRELRADKQWREIPAVRQGHVAVVSDQIDMPAPGLVDVIEQLAQELHPEIFGSAYTSSNGDLAARAHTATAAVRVRHALLEASPCAR